MLNSFFQIYILLKAFDTVSQYANACSTHITHSRVSMIKKSLITIAVCSSMLTFSCSESPNSPGKTNSQDVTADLQKLANTVNNLGMLDNSKKQERSLQKAKMLEDNSCNSCFTPGPHSTAEHLSLHYIFINTIQHK